MTNSELKVVGRAESSAAKNHGNALLPAAPRSLEETGLTIMVAGTTPEDERDFGVEGNG